MKKRKLIIGSLLAAMLAPISLCFTGCKEEKPFDINAKDVYAMCVISSVEYLKNIVVAEPQGVSDVVFVNSVRPSIVDDVDIMGIKTCLSMFDEIVTSGIKQTTRNNTSNVDGLSRYRFEMEITLTNNTVSNSYMMYYNEIKTSTEEEIEDAKLEVEVSTLLEGVLVVGDERFVVKGEREFERDGREEESSIEFTTYLDNQNYITFEQSVEDGEIEYEYSIFEHGQKIEEMEFEMEKTKRGYEIEFHISNAGTSQIEYQIYVGNNSKIIVVLRKNKEKEMITVEQDGNNYNFIYSNGFSEIV